MAQYNQPSLTNHSLGSFEYIMVVYPEVVSKRKKKKKAKPFFIYIYSLDSVSVDYKDSPHLYLVFFPFVK